MELKQLWSVIQRRWWLILLPMVIAVVLVLPSLRLVTTSIGGYRVGVRFTASQQPTSSNSSFEDKSYIPWLASEYVVINLAQWVRTDSFAREVVAELGTQNRDDLKSLPADSIRAAIVSDAARSILTILVDWPDSAQIEAIANAAVKVLRERSQSYFPQLSAVKAEVVALDNVIVTTLPVPLSTRIGPLLRMLIGLAAGIGLAFLAEYLDNTLRSRAEVETSLGVPVLTEIPRY